MKIGCPSVTDLEREYLDEAILMGDISQGEFIKRFEDKWAEMNSRKYGVSCNSGTSAILLALQALGIGEGDEVIAPEFCMSAVAFGISNVGATPVFIDCLDDLTIDPVQFSKSITEKTKAVLVVPIYGRPVSPTVYQIARDKGIFIIEDFAEAHGIEPKGDITCYSFQANKILTTGEGGMCLTDEEKIAKEIRKLSSLYFDEKRTMLHDRVANNFRMTNLQAAIGLAQCERFEELKNKRIEIAGWYDKYLPRSLKMPPRSVVWVYDIQSDNQEELMQKLALNGIETRYGFKPMSQQKMYYNKDYRDLNAYRWSKRVLYLPTYYELTEDDVKYICEYLK